MRVFCFVLRERVFAKKGEEGCEGEDSKSKANACKKASFFPF
jgi:hypothetical protein